MDLKLSEQCFDIVVDIVNTGFSKITAKVARPSFGRFHLKVSSQGSKKLVCDFISLCFLIANTAARDAGKDVPL